MESCCSRADAGAEGGGVRARRTWLARAGGAVEWGTPIALLALMPKCPGCVAAYVLLFTGIGVSFSAAQTLRWTMIAACVAVLTWLVGRAAYRRLARR